MDKENRKNNTAIEVSPLKEVDPTSRLVRAVTIVKEFRRCAEQNGLAAGSGIAEDILIRNIPTLGYIVDGDLRNNSSQNDNIADRVRSLPGELVEDTQNKLDLLLSITDVAPSIAPTRRLAAYLPLTLPRTRDGLTALRFISIGYKAGGLLPDTGQLATSLSNTAKQLSLLDSAVITAARKDETLLQSLTEEATEQARFRLPELIREGSDQVAEMRSLVAEDKMRVLRRETVQASGAREYSKYEVLAKQIIARDCLAEQSDELQERRNQTLEKARDAVLGSITRRRANQRVVALIDSDSLLRQALAKRRRMSSQELLEADEALKREVADNALNTRPIILSSEDRLVFNGEAVTKEERQRVEQELQDPLLFISQLSDKELQIIRRGMPKISDSKSIFDLAKERLRKELEEGVTDEELLEVLTKSITRELLSERCADAIDLAVRENGITPNSVLGNPSILSDSAEAIIRTAIQNLRPKTVSRVETQTPRLENEQPPKPYTFTVPPVTIGKSQLIAPLNLLRFGTSVTTAQTSGDLGREVEALIASSREFDGYFSSGEAAFYYPPEKKAEMLFSMVGRGAGSKLAGTPLFELRDDMEGVDAVINSALNRNLEVKEKYGKRLIANSVRLSPLMARIGRQYKDRLTRATQLVAQGVDVVSGNLNSAINASGAKRIPVEEVTNFIRTNLNTLLNTPIDGRIPGRSVIQMDYFLLYPPEIRRRILETFKRTGSLENLRGTLARNTTEGNMRMTIFDISGGSGGVGITEILAQRLLGRSSGHMEAYLDALLGSYELRIGKTPEQIVIAPREADLTLMNFEYTVVEAALRARGILRVGITTLELLQQSIEVAERTGRRLQVPTLKGEVIAPELVIKRFTFPNEGRGVGYRGDIISEMPNGVILEPNNSSRIVASDKRINSQILTALEPQLDQLGVEVMPFLDIGITGRSLGSIADEIVGFMKANRKHYPEIDFLGAVLKTGDKIPGREGGAGEVISAYPVPASVIDNPEMQRLFIGKKIRELILKGVTGVIVQPNVLSLVVDNNGKLLPKFELKMMAFANQRR